MNKENKTFFEVELQQPDFFDPEFSEPQGGGAISPSIKVEETVVGVFITVTDKYGTTTATVYNGKDGKDGVGIEKITIKET